MKKKHAVIGAVCALGFVAVGTIWFSGSKGSSSTDAALLALIKNDISAFESFLDAGGDVHAKLPKMDGTVYTVAEGVAYFERAEFAKLLNTKKISFLKQDASADFDIMTLSVKKNNPVLFTEITTVKPDYKLAYGKNGWNLLHMASAWCSHKVVSDLHKKGLLNWNDKAKDGSTPLTLAAQNECLPVLSYWKLEKADFKAKDGKGQSALSILKSKKDPALTAFADSFSGGRSIASVSEKKAAPEVPNFYKKRVIPKDQIVDHSAMLEPEDRPLEAVETADNSEFAD